MEALKIVAFATAAAIVYGVLHDQITAHLCVEYFTVAHPPIFNATKSPFLLALGWGVIATWWVGLPLGLMLAAAARFGASPKLALADLRMTILALMLCVAAGAALAGASGAYLVSTGQVPVPGAWGKIIPADRQIAFFADAYAHLASYAFGIIGGIIVVLAAIVRRARRHPQLRSVVE